MSQILHISKIVECTVMLRSPSLLCLPHDRPMNWRRGVEGRNVTERMAN